MTVNTKFRPDDIVWVMKDNVPIQDRINSVDITIYLDWRIQITYNLEYSGKFPEKETFGTRDELKDFVFGEDEEK